MRTAVIIGRFQPFHIGHLQAIKQIEKSFDKLIIILGTPVSKSDISLSNPLTTPERKKILKVSLKTIKIPWVLKVQRDVGVDYLWRNEIAKKIPKDSVVFSGNIHVLNVFKNHYKTFHIKKEVKIRAAFIRHWVKAGSDKWMAFVPKKIIPILNKADLRGRLLNANKAGSKGFYR